MKIGTLPDEDVHPGDVLHIQFTGVRQNTVSLSTQWRVVNSNPWTELPLIPIPEHPLECYVVVPPNVSTLKLVNYSGETWGSEYTANITKADKATALLQAADAGLVPGSEVVKTLPSRISL